MEKIKDDLKAHIIEINRIEGLGFDDDCKDGHALLLAAVDRYHSGVQMMSRQDEHVKYAITKKQQTKKNKNRKLQRRLNSLSKNKNAWDREGRATLDHIVNEVIASGIFAENGLTEKQKCRAFNSVVVKMSNKYSICEDKVRAAARNCADSMALIEDKKFQDDILERKVKGHDTHLIGRRLDVSTYAICRVLYDIRWKDLVEMVDIAADEFRQ